MAATIVPLLTLAIIVIVLIVALVPRRRVANGDPSQIESDRRAYALVLRDRLDRALFGPALAGQIWDRLMQCPVGEGLIHEFHRDYCGHGLIRTDKGVKLSDILDGHHVVGPAIAEWPSREGFVSFFAEQSDYSCSGWDASSPVFVTEDDWHRNNQRLTRAKLLHWLAGPAPSGA
ncbi:MAG TPA: hypothetical protein VGN82_07515 [Bosea sp. (in: a-proteobacteria)]|jgi:hypothetical protein|uniref:hypothetical protein n=1 Tax=Bosea sp. (in: a-proteobacteria) TaxID=1871050 RepID=UPI002E0E5F96|nr:hypothetical protein [Bosea sp. (in: a-proteobacteria)]